MESKFKAFGFLNENKSCPVNAATFCARLNVLEITGR